MSKGDKPRPVNRKLWDEGWEKIYEAKKRKAQQVAKQGMSLRKRQKV